MLECVFMCVPMPVALDGVVRFLRLDTSMMTVQSEERRGEEERRARG
jgi:hypothetical protein